MRRHSASSRALQTISRKAGEAIRAHEIHFGEREICRCVESHFAERNPKGYEEQSLGYEHQQRLTVSGVGRFRTIIEPLRNA